MLTIVGYSINATIVIFDRIREELKVNGAGGDLKELVNRCITQTLTRSIYTSLTTFIMVAVLYVLGVSSIKEFALPLMVGIICGAYSSVCITGALWYVMKTRGQAKQAAVSADGVDTLAGGAASVSGVGVSGAQGTANTSNSAKKKNKSNKKKKRR